MENFWTKIGDFFSKIGTNLYKFWIQPDGDGVPYLATFGLALVVLVIGYILIRLIIRLVRKALKIDKKSFTKDKTIKNFSVNTLKVVLYVILLLLFLGILGIKLDGFESIFSSAILAVGLSLQDIVGNFASGIIILSSKPFVADDYVYFPSENVEGTVKDVLFLTTILETVNGQKIVIPNKNITSTNIVNYSSNPIRRVVVNVGISIDTDKDALKKLLLKLAKDDKRVLYDPEPSVVISGLEENIFSMALRCYVPCDLYWDILYDLYNNIFDEFKKSNVRIGVKRINITNEFGDTVDLNNKKVIKKGN